ncbi:hypothetical protein NFI96_005265 [Prochilodus magdalenae]|nr:hypothetical protein NFI96_005265 [Prochilodus magdalenae]
MALEGNASCADCVSQSARNSSPGAQAASGPVTGTLAGILIFTIVVDIVGNLLVILSVCRNKKLRNAVSVSAGTDVRRIGSSHLDSEQIPLRSLLGRRSLTGAHAINSLDSALEHAPASRMKHHIRPDLAEASVTLGLDSAAAAKKSVLWGLLSRDGQSETIAHLLLHSAVWSSSSATAVDTGRCPQDAAHRTLPTGRCPRDAAPQDPLHRALPTGHSPQDAAHRTLPTGHCRYDAALRTLSTGHY